MLQNHFESSRRINRFGAKRRIDVREIAEDIDETPPSSPRWIEDEDKNDYQVITISGPSNAFSSVPQKPMNTLFTKRFQLPFHFETECMNQHFIPPLEDFGWVSQPTDDLPLGLQSFVFDDDSSTHENPYFY
jgi:hypothetical protein